MTGERVVMTDQREALSYDPECYDLAKHYLPWLIGERFRVSLAEALTKAVEAWIVEHKTEVEHFRAAQQKFDRFQRDSERGGASWKACPRCGGAAAIGKDRNDCHWAGCRQCGFVLSSPFDWLLYDEWNRATKETAERSDDGASSECGSISAPAKSEAKLLE
jgi:hypothetical protein